MSSFSMPLFQFNKTMKRAKSTTSSARAAEKMRVLGVSEGHFQGKKHTHWPDSNKGLQQFIL